ncbi:MAG: hypothetical protein JW801_09830 [Bacteroidales bacterium]|nr:hypothetical protein [Bacteroidales bacterium]
MIQDIVVYIIIVLALVRVVYQVISSFSRKDSASAACSGCAGYNTKAGKLKHRHLQVNELHRY